MRVNVARPLGYLAVAGVLAAVSLLVPDPTAARPDAAGQATGPAPVASTPAPPCTGVRDSLRPAGPLPAPGAMPAGSTMAAIVRRGRLIVGVDQGKYLLGFRDPFTGLLQGSDIDLARTVAAALFGDPDRVQLLVLNIADRSAAIERGDVDMVANSFAITCERQRTVEYSSPYMAVFQRLLVPLGSGVREVEDLAGRRVCTSEGSTTVGSLDALGLRLDVVTRPGIPDCVVALQRGQVDAVSSDDAILAGLAQQDPQSRIVGRPLLASVYGIGMRPDQPDLVRFVNGVLERARADGSLAASTRRWLGVELNPLPPVPPARYRD